MSDFPKASPTKPRKRSDVPEWDFETDVAVVGIGGAGGCAAIEAADGGADVIIFELASANGGTTALSSAEVYMGGSGGIPRTSAGYGSGMSVGDATFFGRMAGKSAAAAPSRD